MPNAKHFMMPTYRALLIKAQVYRAMNAYMSEVLKPFNLTPPDWVLVGALYETDGMQPTQIASFIGVKPPVVTAALRRLTASNIVAKKRHATDSRVVVVTLTSSGKKLVQQIEDKVLSDLSSFMEGISEAHVTAYLHVLELVYIRLRTNKA